MKKIQAQIVATLGPASSDRAVVAQMMQNGMDVARLNCSWDTLENHATQIQLVKMLAKETGRFIPIIIDLPGPRIQEKVGHTYDPRTLSSITEHDQRIIRFAVEQNVEYIAVSFVGTADDINTCRKIIKENRGTQKIIAKIERKVALDSLDEIISAADAVMVARGDLGNEIPLEQIPFIQEKIVKASKKAGKPVIVATQMMLSMVENAAPTRAEVTDVENAIVQGTDAVMLSEETAEGKFPAETVAMMEKIILETERHMENGGMVNLL